MQEETEEGRSSEAPPVEILCEISFVSLSSDFCRACTPRTCSLSPQLPGGGAEHVGERGWWQGQGGSLRPNRRNSRGCAQFSLG